MKLESGKEEVTNNYIGRKLTSFTTIVHHWLPVVTTMDMIDIRKPIIKVRFNHGHTMVENMAWCVLSKKLESCIFCFVCVGFDLNVYLNFK